MKDEFQFCLPGRDQFYSITRELEHYDEILLQAIRETNRNIRRGYIILTQNHQNGHDQDPRPRHLGLISVEDARRKFG